MGKGGASGRGQADIVSSSGVIPLALIGAVPLLIFIPVVVILIFVMYK